jgi:glucose-6-phosphate isomerase
MGREATPSHGAVTRAPTRGTTLPAWRCSLDAWPPTLFLHGSRLPWSLDATAMRLDPAALDALPWARAFEGMRHLEAGAIANPDEGRQVGHYWLRSPERAPDVQIARAIDDAATAVRLFAERVHEGLERTEDDQAFTDVLHLGIGGSQLGPQLLIDALGHDDQGRRLGLRLHFLDNTDPDGIHTALARLGERLTTTLVVVVSKSGSTVETANALELARRALMAKGLRPGAHLVAITQEGSKLHAQAQAQSWRIAFPIWDHTGGRFSVTSAVGLLPAALAGIDTEALLAGAAAMDDWTRTTDWRSNPAALLAGAWYLAGDGVGRRAMVVLPYADRLVTLSRYLQQLVMESVGKREDLSGRVVHQGLTVYGNKGSTDQHAYVQQLRDGPDDFFATFVQVLRTSPHDPVIADQATAGDHLQGFFLGTRRALQTSGKRSLTLTVPEITPAAVGGLLALFERAVGLYALLIGINAYHQPGVEAGKLAARDMLAASRAMLAHLKAGPATLTVLASAAGIDLIEAHHLLQRLALTGRVRHSGASLDGTYQLPA